MNIMSAETQVAAFPPALSVEGVSHAYGQRRVLDKVSLTVPQGRFTALLGLNGAGKTTLLSLITRLFDTQSGSISVLGHRIDREPGEALRRLGVVFQARTLDLDLSVMDNLLFHAALHGIGGREARRLGMAALADVGMAERAKDKARNLSGGQMRRVESHVRCCMGRVCWCSMNRRSGWMSRRSWRSLRMSAAWCGTAASACCGRPICWTRSSRRTTSWCWSGQGLARGVVADVVAAAGKDTLRAAFATLTEAP